ncbi:MAG TPA: sugar porter family MFS transporter [Candidatus Dormibacteraeota bacterium]|nr:sugar porter family MFS transporter [Candidatus Dormibacteraeota bacterium]
MKDGPPVSLAPRPGFAVLVASVAALGGLLFGYDTGVISGAILFITHAFALSTQVQEFTISVVLLGAMLGALGAGALADRIGRRPTLLLAGSVFCLGAILSASAPSIEVLLVARLIVGLAIGLSSVIAPLYISEVAPASSRGALVSLYQFAITIGILAAFLVDYALSQGGAWREMLGLALIPSLVLIFGMLIMPESPRYLLRIGRAREAADELVRIHGSAQAQVEEDSIRTALRESTGGLRVFSEPAIRTALFIGIGLAVLQQITGINTVIYYGPRIFQMAGVSANSAAIFATALVGAVNCGMTIVAILFVDRVGRKPLLYCGVAGMFLALATLAVAFAQAHLGATLGNIAMGAMMIYVGSFAYSLGPILWLLISEIFPLRARALGMSLCTLGNWVANFLVSQFFLTMIEGLGRPLTFGIYAALCLVTILFVARFVPETKRELLESIRLRGRARGI